MNGESGDDFGTQVIQPVSFRYPTAWMSWQAVLGDLAARGHVDARLAVEATGSPDSTLWTAEIEWGDAHERVIGADSMASALSALWGEVIARHPIYPGDLTQRGPAVYEAHECLDVPTQAAIQRLLSTVRAAFNTEWVVLLSYHPVLRAPERVHARLVAQNGEVSVTAGGASLIEGARMLLRAAAPYFPKQKPKRGG